MLKQGPSLLLASAPAALPTLQPASPLAAPITTLTYVTLGLGLAIFALVTGLTFYFVWRYRHRGAEGEPPQIFGNARDEVVWMLMAGGILVFLFILTWITMNRIDPQAGQDGTPDVIVTGHQWFWEASYPRATNPAGLGVVSTAGEIHIPTGKKLLLQVGSADVIHDFWAPQLARKMDAIPGQGNRLWIQADKPGTYLGACSEFCGAQHAWMRFKVIAQTPQDFQAWLARQARQAAPPPPVQAEALAGAALFVRQGCGECHTLRGVGARGTVGPDLTHFASRGIIAGGVLDNTPDNLRRWLHNPQAVKPGVRMPNYRLNDAQLRQLTAYLETLQ
ncbi:cytochrome c oxidase subunit II (plasmid) [Deinococcus sp. D7000]|nr:cytochrome c oxidase subunit II [Deinococcus sp. D7000]